MASFHQQRGAEVSIAAVRVPIAQASAFGIMATGPGGELREFQEKPETPSPIPTDPSHAYASMGNYLFNPRVSWSCWRRPIGTAPRISVATSCRSCLAATAHGRTTLRHNEVPGVRPYEERGYWRDIGTIEAYRAAQRDVRGLSPRFDLANREWPIRSSGYRLPETAQHAEPETQFRRSCQKSALRPVWEPSRDRACPRRLRDMGRFPGRPLRKAGGLA